MSLPINVEVTPVTGADFEELAVLRVAAMRESLERVGRFDPVRARERLRSSFKPESTRFIELEGVRVGFYAAHFSSEGWRLEHLYVHPDFQNRGIGGAVLKTIIAEADALGVPVSVEALKESASNRFYRRYGFELAGESEWDNYYRRPAPGSPRDRGEQIS